MWEDGVANGIGTYLVEGGGVYDGTWTLGKLKVNSIVEMELP